MSFPLSPFPRPLTHAHFFSPASISPNLLEELKNSTAEVPKKLNAEAAAHADPIAKVSYIDNEPEFQWELVKDKMAFDKLHEGIRKFAEDADTLRGLLRKKLEGTA